MRVMIGVAIILAAAGIAIADNSALQNLSDLSGMEVSIPKIESREVREIAYYTPGRPDELFAKYPLDAKNPITTSHGFQVLTPYHNYEADGLLLYGTADLAALRSLAAGTSYQPVETSEGKGILSVWLMDYKDTSVGPYQELVITFLASQNRITFPYKDDYSLLIAAAVPGVAFFPVRLWLGPMPAAQKPIDYGNDILGLDKRPGSIHIEHRGRIELFELSEGGKPFRALIEDEDKVASSVKTLRGFIRNIGVKATIQAMMANEVHSTAVASNGPERGKSFDVIIKSKPVVTVLADVDRIELGDGDAGRTLAKLGANFRIATHDDEIKFVVGSPGKPLKPVEK